MFVHKRITLF